MCLSWFYAVEWVSTLISCCGEVSLAKKKNEVLIFTYLLKSFRVSNSLEMYGRSALEVKKKRN